MKHSTFVNTFLIILATFWVSELHASREFINSLVQSDKTESAICSKVGGGYTKADEALAALRERLGDGDAVEAIVGKVEAYNAFYDESLAENPAYVIGVIRINDDVDDKHTTILINMNKIYWNWAKTKGYDIKNEFTGNTTRDNVKTAHIVNFVLNNNLPLVGCTIL